MKAFAVSLMVTLAPHSTLYSDAWPPDRFKGNAIVKVRFADPRDINGPFCGKAPAGMVTEACTFFDKDSGEWIVTLPNPNGFPKSDDYARLVAHEIGHANGWPATHGL